MDNNETSTKVIILVGMLAIAPTVRLAEAVYKKIQGMHQKANKNEHVPLWDSWPAFFACALYVGFGAMLHSHSGIVGAGAIITSACGIVVACLGIVDLLATIVHNTCVGKWDGKE